MLGTIGLEPIAQWENPSAKEEGISGPANAFKITIG
jgi:hypothetical protein